MRRSFQDIQQAYRNQVYRIFDKELDEMRPEHRDMSL